MDTSSVNRRRTRQITNVMESQSVRRSPRLSQRFISRLNTGDSNESLERSSLVTTYHHSSRVTRSSDGENVAVLNESGQRFPANETFDSTNRTKQVYHEKKVSTRQTTSYSSTTGQPYTGSPIEVGTESSEDSDTEAVSQSAQQSTKFISAPNITPNVTERFRSATSTSFRPRRTDMPRNLFGLDDDGDGDVEYITRQRFIHHKERILTPPRGSTDTTDSRIVTQNMFWHMSKQAFWRITSFFYLISTWFIYVDIEIHRRLYSLVNPTILFYQRISDIRQRSFGSFCYLMLLAVAAVPLVCLLCGVSFSDRRIDPGYQPADGEINAFVLEILQKEMPSQLDSFKRDLEVYFKNLIIQELSSMRDSIIKKETSLVEAMNQTLLDRFYALSESLNNRIEELGYQLNSSFITLVTQLQYSVDRNLSWSEGNITVNLTYQRQVELKKMNDTYQLIFQHHQDMLIQLKKENQNLLKETKIELFDVIESKALEADQKRQLTVAKLEKVMNDTEKLDESVLGLEKNLQELRSVADLLLKNGSSNITAVLQQLNNVTNEIVQLRINFQEQLNKMRESHKSESDIENKMAIVFRDELNKVLSDDNSTLLVQLGKLFATATDIQDVRADMQNQRLENLEKLGSATPPIPDNITEDMVMALIKKELEKYSADRLGKFDFALHSAGACVTDQKSPTFIPQSRKSQSYIEWLFAIKPRDANTILDPNVYPGQCWAFKGQKGYVVIKLAQNIEITEVVIEHLPKILSPYGNISSAPENFSVLVSQSLEDDWVPVGDFVYTGEKIIHEFAIQEVPENLKFVRYVKFDFKSNHGKKEFTCIYRVRVHGNLYKKDDKKS